MASVGDSLIYNPAHGLGYGHNARGEELTAEMHELDLKPGTPAELLDIDEETGYVIVKWIDDIGIDRNTSVEPSQFDAEFEVVTS